MESTAPELAYRRDGGIEIALYWDRRSGRLTVTIDDLASGEAFRVRPIGLSTPSITRTHTPRHWASCTARSRRTRSTPRRRVRAIGHAGRDASKP
jgi:hypothetical protein